MTHKYVGTNDCQRVLRALRHGRWVPQKTLELRALPLKEWLPFLVNGGYVERRSTFDRSIEYRILPGGLKAVEPLNPASRVAGRSMPQGENVRGPNVRVHGGMGKIWSVCDE